MNAGLLRAFSRRATERLRAALPLRLALPALEPILEENVEKEVRKDAAVIGCAAEALARGGAPSAGDVQRLLAEAREIDRAFLARAGRLPVRIEVPYERIDPLRRRRIELGLVLARTILQAWGEGAKLRRAIPPEALEQRLLEILRLYAEETHALAHAVHLPGLLAPLRNRVARHLRDVLTEAARVLARDAARPPRPGRRGV